MLDDRSEFHIAERIGALALDAAEVERWKEIAKAVDSVLRPTGRN